MKKKFRVGDKVKAVGGLYGKSLAHPFFLFREHHTLEITTVDHADTGQIGVRVMGVTLSLGPDIEGTIHVRQVVARVVARKKRK